MAEDQEPETSSTPLTRTQRLVLLGKLAHAQYKKRLVEAVSRGEARPKPALISSLPTRTQMLAAAGLAQWRRVKARRDAEAAAASPPEQPRSLTDPGVLELLEGRISN